MNLPLPKLFCHLALLTRPPYPHTNHGSITIPSSSPANHAQSILSLARRSHELLQIASASTLRILRCHTNSGADPHHRQGRSRRWRPIAAKGMRWPEPLATRPGASGGRDPSPPTLTCRAPPPFASISPAMCGNENCINSYHDAGKGAAGAGGGAGAARSAGGGEFGDRPSLLLRERGHFIGAAPSRPSRSRAPLPSPGPPSPGRLSLTHTAAQVRILDPSAPVAATAAEARQPAGAGVADGWGERMTYVPRCMISFLQSTFRESVYGQIWCAGLIHEIDQNE